MVRGLAGIVEAHALTELIYDTPEVTLTLRRSGGVEPAPVHAPQAYAPPAMHQDVHSPVPAVPALAPAAAPAAAPVAAADELHHLVTSPFVGTFYRRPSPDADVYAEVGQRVEKGQALCIIEAMKLMNEIESDVTGVVMSVLVDDTTPVEYGQPLFKIRPA